MIRIFMIVLFIILLYLFILALYHFFNRAAEESKDIFDKSGKPEEDDADTNCIYNSAINFDNVSIKDRHYLNTFIDEINPDLPKMQRLNKDTVEIKSFLFNKKYDKKGE